MGLSRPTRKLTRRPERLLSESGIRTLDEQGSDHSASTRLTGALNKYRLNTSPDASSAHSGRIARADDLAALHILRNPPGSCSGSCTLLQSSVDDASPIPVAEDPPVVYRQESIQYKSTHSPHVDTIHTLFQFPSTHDAVATGPREASSISYYSPSSEASTSRSTSTSSQGTIDLPFGRPICRLSRYSSHGNLHRPKTATVRSLRRTQSAHFGGVTPSSTSSSLSGSSGFSSTNTLVGCITPPSRENKRWHGMLKAVTRFSRSPLSLAYLEAGRSEANKDHEAFITRHIAGLAERQDFILKLARAMMMFGGPSHRLQALVQSTAGVLDIQLSCMYMPDFFLISFEESDTSNSTLRLVHQSGSIDIGKLKDVYDLYWKVIHDNISVKDAATELDHLMLKSPLYNIWQLALIGGLGSSVICNLGYKGSFIDSLVSFPLGCALILIRQFASYNALYSNVFELTVATLFSFISAALASTQHFCYSAVTSASIVMILPGSHVLIGSLELSSRQLVSGAVRICFALIYSLFLGFGLAFGAKLYVRMTDTPLFGENDLHCTLTHHLDGPWWQKTPPLIWAFITVPLYSFLMSMRNYAPWNRKEIVLLVLIASAGWAANHLSAIRFDSQKDIAAAIGALTVGFISNLYGRFFNGNAFIIMISGIYFQLPSGLASGGILNFAAVKANGAPAAESYLSGLETALQLISVSIGLTVVLGISLVLVYPFQSRRRAGGVFSL